MTFLLFTLYLLLIQAATAVHDGPGKKQSFSTRLKQVFTRRAPKAQRERGSDDFSISDVLRNSESGRESSRPRSYQGPFGEAGLDSGIGPGASSTLSRQLARTQTLGAAKPATIPSTAVSYEESDGDLLRYKIKQDPASPRKQAHFQPYKGLPSAFQPYEGRPSGAGLHSGIGPGASSTLPRQLARTQTLGAAKTATIPSTVSYEESDGGDLLGYETTRPPASARRQVSFQPYEGRPSGAGLHSGIGPGASSTLPRQLTPTQTLGAAKPATIPSTAASYEESDGGDLLGYKITQAPASPRKQVPFQPYKGLPSGYATIRGRPRLMLSEHVIEEHQKRTKKPIGDPRILKTPASATTGQPSGAGLPSGIGPGMVPTMQRIKIGGNQQLAQQLQRKRIIFSTFQ